MRTRVGYTGGRTADPTYHSLGDHTEAFQVEYDPSVVTYEQLLELFWADHNPYSSSWSRQYRAAVFYHDESQKELALRQAKRLAAAGKRTVKTAVEEAGPFYPAEDYHQKYYLRRFGKLLKELTFFYPRGEELVRSTAAARLNGYLGGHGTEKDLEREIESLGLSESSRNLLREYVRAESPQRACPLPARKRNPPPRRSKSVR